MPSIDSTPERSNLEAKRGSVIFSQCLEQFHLPVSLDSFGGSVWKNALRMSAVSVAASSFTISETRSVLGGRSFPRGSAGLGVDGLIQNTG